MTALASSILALVLSGGPVQAAGRDLGCEPSTQWEKETMPLFRETLGCRKDGECLKKLHPRWLDKLAAVGRDMRTYWNYGTSYADTDASALAEANLKAKRDADPRDPFFATAYGHALKADSPEQIAAYEAGLKLDPDYAWAHYYLASRFSGRGGSEHRDTERARTHVRAWLAACPADEAGMRIAGRIGDKALATEMAELGRKALAGETGDFAARRYEGLWTLEFKSAPTSEHEALRARVRADIERVKKAGDTIRVLQVVQAGYALIGDKEARAAVETEMATRFPCEAATLRARMASWDKEHPRPEFHAEETVRREYDTSRYAFETELATACPANAFVAQARVRTARSLPDLSAKEAEAVLDDLLAARAKEPSATSSMPMADPAVELAVNLRVRVEKLPELLKGWTESAPPEPRKDESDSQRRGRESMTRRSRFDRIWLTARADNLVGRKAERDAALPKMEELIEQADYDRSSLEARVAWLQAEIAELKGRHADAMVFFQSAASGLRSDEHFLRAARAALRRAGASDAALARLVPPKRVRPPVLSSFSPWKDVERPLPAASLELVGGGRWAFMDDLKGKRTLVNVWATWCGPCKKELPELQKLQERIKGRSDVAIVALNVDDNPGVVDPFLKEHGYTFPVALGSEFWDSLKLDSRGIPQNWIVDEKGVARAELRGFGSTEGDKWVRDALAQLEGKKADDKAAASANAAGTE